MQKRYLIQNISDYQNLILDIAPRLKNGCLVLFEGGLGAGKTTLISQILKYYHIHMVASPTYAFHHRYKNESFVFDHFDLYRLESVNEVESIGFWDLIQQNQTGVIFVEWPSRVADDEWPLDRKIIRINLKIDSDQIRILTLEVS